MAKKSPTPRPSIEDEADLPLTGYIKSLHGEYRISDPEGLARLIKDIEYSRWHQVDRIVVHAGGYNEATELVLKDPKLRRDLVGSLFTQRWMEKALERMRAGEDVTAFLHEVSSRFGQER
jgi:hypothetical protein